MEQVGGEEGVVTASGAMEAAGQIDLDDADSAAPEEGPGDEPQTQKRDPVSAAAVINLKTGTLKPRPGGGQGGLRIHNFHPKNLTALNSCRFICLPYLSGQPSPVVVRNAGVWPESGFLGGRGRGRHPANDKSGAQRAEAEAERLLEGDMGREAVGGVRGGGPREEEEEHQLRTLRRLEEGKSPMLTFAFMFSSLHIKPSCAHPDIQSLAKQIANKTVQV